MSGLRGDELHAWTKALTGTREAWASAYVGQPARRRERALVAVAQDPDRVPLPLSGVCVECDRPTPPQRRRAARYCGDECRQAANYRRERRRAAA